MSGWKPATKTYVEYPPTGKGGGGAGGGGGGGGGWGAVYIVKVVNPF